MRRHFISVLTLAIVSVATVGAQDRDRVPNDRTPRVMVGIKVEPTGQGTEPKGLIVREVLVGSPAARAGLQKGDVLTRLRDKDVSDADGLLDALSGKKPGDQMTFQVRREGQDRTLTVTLGDPQAPRQPEPDGPPAKRAPAQPDTDSARRMVELERKVERLEERLRALEKRLGDKPEKE